MIHKFKIDIYYHLPVISLLDMDYFVRKTLESLGLSQYIEVSESVFL